MKSKEQWNRNDIDWLLDLSLKHEILRAENSFFTLFTLATFHGYIIKQMIPPPPAIKNNFVKTAKIWVSSPRF